MSSLNLIDELELTESEELVLKEIAKNPVLVKYLKGLAVSAMQDACTAENAHSSHAPSDAAIRLAHKASYMQGVLAIVYQLIGIGELPTPAPNTPQ